MKLALVFHNHQPVGQLPWAFEDAWRDSYSPFLDELEKHPAIRVALHYTGPLLDWLIEYRPEFIERLRALVERGQVELLAGGYYEPILAIWPPEDQVAQLVALRDKIRSLFDTVPSGLWLAERVWEPELAVAAQAAELKYTFVDSTVFEDAGLSEADQHGYYTARSGAGEVQVFPINQQLRHSIPWDPVQKAIAYLKDVHEETGGAGLDPLAVFADDGEKFGAWPGTFDYVFTKGWLDNFFAAIEENSAWLETVTPGDYLKTSASRGEAKLQAGSYSEMQDWSGGNWRNFLDRYDESRDLYEEVLRAREKVLAVAATSSSNALSEAAYDHILRAQCNDAYWHGVFGGLYLRHLRQAIFRETAEAMNIIAPAHGHGAQAKITRECDETVFLETATQKIGARAQDGQLFQWTSLIARHNILSTLRRYSETYHHGIGISDWHARGGLSDHFLGAEVTPEEYAGAQYAEDGDFASEKWHISGEETGGAAIVRLLRQGGVWHQAHHHPLTIEKRLTARPDSDTIEFLYLFTNTGDAQLELRWANEWNLALSGAELPERHYHADDHKTRLSLGEPAIFESVKNPIAADLWLQLWFEWDFADSPTLWHIPVETISQKEGGHIERTHQSSAFVFIRPLTLEPGETRTVEFTATLTAKERPASRV